MNTSPPAGHKDEYFYRTIATRTQPVVSFPSSGDVTRAGVITVEYAVKLEAVKRIYTQQAVGVSNTQCRPAPDELGAFATPGLHGESRAMSTPTAPLRALRTVPAAPAGRVRPAAVAHSIGQG